MRLTLAYPASQLRRQEQILPPEALVLAQEAAFGGIPAELQAEATGQVERCLGLGSMRSDEYEELGARICQQDMPRVVTQIEGIAFSPVPGHPRIIREVPNAHIVLLAGLVWVLQYLVRYESPADLVPVRSNSPSPLTCGVSQSCIHAVHKNG